MPTPEPTPTIEPGGFAGVTATWAETRWTHATGVVDAARVLEILAERPLPNDAADLAAALDDTTDTSVMQPVESTPRQPEATGDDNDGEEEQG